MKWGRRFASRRSMLGDLVTDDYKNCASQIVFFRCRVDMQAQIAFGKNNPSSILNLRVGSHRYKKILCNHLQFIKYFVVFYTLSLQSDSHFPWMVLLPDEVLWSHLALPEKPRWFHLYNLESVISMSTKSDPKYASFEFSSLQNKGVLWKIPPFWRQLSSPSAILIVVRHETTKNTSYPLLQN